MTSILGLILFSPLILIFGGMTLLFGYFALAGILDGSFAMLIFFGILAMITGAMTLKYIIQPKPN